MLGEIYQLATEAQEIDLFNPTALEVLNQLEKVHNYQPSVMEPEPTAALDSKPIEEEQTAIMDEEEAQAIPEEGETKLIVFILGGALTIALAVIIFLSYRLGLKKGQ